ncbi:hypothetical protein LCGC14_2531360 [marine sediment metagenome]|uniref:Uncharacterized protein n=1 Tax=marine sediment metagenome TaxID=412755 RepID=A0A0F9DLP2_9ZZZZ
MRILIGVLVMVLWCGIGCNARREFNVVENELNHSMADLGYTYCKTGETREELHKMIREILGEKQ